MRRLRRWFIIKNLSLLNNFKIKKLSVVYLIFFCIFLFQNIAIAQVANHQVAEIHAFDIDQTVLNNIESKVYIRGVDKQGRPTGVDVGISNVEFAIERTSIGIQGKYAEFEMYEDSFREYRVGPKGENLMAAQVEKTLKRRSQNGKSDWAGPAWEIFKYISENARSINLDRSYRRVVPAIITARAHPAEHAYKAMYIQLNKMGLLSSFPSWAEMKASIYTVSNQQFSYLEKNDIEGDKANIEDRKKGAIVELIRRHLQSSGLVRFYFYDDERINLDKASEVLEKLKPEERKRVELVLVDFSGEKMGMGDGTVIRGRSKKQISSSDLRKEVGIQEVRSCKSVM